MGNKAKRQTLLVVESGRHESGSPGIWHTNASFFFGVKYLKGHERAGSFDRAGLSDSEVRVRWQHDTQNPSDYAPEVRFALENSSARRLAQKIAKAAERIKARYEDVTRERLVAEMKATSVSHAGDAWTWKAVAA